MWVNTSTIQNWRACADGCRTMANTFADDHARKKLRRTADDFDQLADKAERANAAETPPNRDS